MVIHHVALVAGRKLWQALTGVMHGGYRPERHYMRGPGPKWHEKHADARLIPARAAASGRMDRGA